jgi:hypothetical protein
MTGDSWPMWSQSTRDRELDDLIDDSDPDGDRVAAVLDLAVNQLNRAEHIRQDPSLCPECAGHGYTRTVTITAGAMRVTRHPCSCTGGS